MTIELILGNSDLPLDTGDFFACKGESISVPMDIHFEMCTLCTYTQ